MLSVVFHYHCTQPKYSLRIVTSEQT